MSRNNFFTWRQHKMAETRDIQEHVTGEGCYRGLFQLVGWFTAEMMMAFGYLQYSGPSSTMKLYSAVVDHGYLTVTSPDRFRVVYLYPQYVQSCNARQLVK